MKRLLGIATSALLLSLAGCGKNQNETASAPPPPAASAPEKADAIQSALSAQDRFVGDAAEDGWRKSNEVLAFLDVKPGMTVLDYFAGGGYYTELLSRVVGPQGRVYAYNNPEYAKYAGDKPKQRYANGRLANVVEVGGAPEQLTIEPQTLDAAIFVQSFHDLHWRSAKGDWPKTDPAQSLAQVVKALKPGAVVLVIDHVANGGSNPDESVDALHRIDPEVVKREFTAAGLNFDSESKLFANPADDHSKLVFDPAVRHTTDQFVFKFKKP